MSELNNDIDPIILRQCRKGHLLAQEALYQQFYSYGLSISLRYAYSREEAVEVLNDSFLKVFDKIQQYEPKNSFKAWLRKIIINTAIDYYRKQNKHRGHYDIADYEYSLSPDESIVAQLNAQDLLKLMGKLPELQRLCFNLYEIEGYSHKEIAKSLEIAEGSARTYLTRAKKNLRALCHQYFDKSYEGIIR